MKLGPQRIQDRSYQKCAEKPLSHGAHGVYAVAFAGKNNVLPLQEGFELVHDGMDPLSCIHDNTIYTFSIACLFAGRKLKRFLQCSLQ